MDETQVPPSEQSERTPNDPVSPLTAAQVTDILDHLRDPLYAVDAHWRITYVNHQAKSEAIWGRRRDDLLGKNVWKAWPQAVGTDAHTQLLRAMQERQPVAVEYESPARTRWYDLRASPSGAGLIISFSDITARKQVELERERLLTELAESQHLFQRIAETSPDLLFVYDFETGQHLYFSGRHEQILGYTADEVNALGQRFATTLWHPDDVASLPTHRRHLQALADDEIYESEYRLRQPDGTYRWLRTRSTVFARRADGQVQQVVGVTQNITAHKQAEAHLVYHALVLAHVHDAVVAADQRLVLTAWNRAAEAMYGYTAAEVIGRDIRTVVRSDYDPDQRAKDYRTLAETGSRRADAIHHRKDGTAFPIEGEISALRDAAGQVTGYIYVFRDIIERKQAEAALRQAQAALEERVVERTSQLSAVNDALRQEITERTRTAELLVKANERVALILDSITDQFFALSHDWRFTYLNQHAAVQMQRLGKEPAALIGKVLWEEFPSVPNEATLRRVMAERVALSDELYYPPLGEWVENYMYPSPDGGLVSFQKYITARKQAEVYSQFQANALAQVHDAVIAIDNENRITYWNAGAEGIYGFTAAEVLDQRLADVNHFRWLNLADEQAAHAVLTASGAWRGENLHRKKSGEDIYVESSVSVLKDERGNPVGLLTIVCDITERKRAEQTRQLLLQRLVTAHEEERRRLARELHDSLGQYLTAFDLGLKVVQTLDGCPTPVAARIDQLRALARLMDAEVEHLTFELRPPALDDLGLADALRDHAQQWSATSGIVVDLHTRGLNYIRLPAVVETTLYRIVQEGLTNILKHAQASHVSLILEQRPDEVLAILEDNGRGFDSEVVPQTATGFGLTSMAERAAQVGGQLDIESAPGAGTTLYVHLPV